MSIGIGLSTEKDSFLATKDALQRAIKNIRQERVDLAIIFSSIEFAHSRTVKTINSLLGPVPVVGCTSAALICNEGIFKHGIAIMLLNFPQGVYFKTASAAEINSKNAFEAGEELGEKLNLGFKDIQRRLAIILSDGLMEDGSGFIYGIQEKLGGNFPIVGASASDNLRFLRTMIYSHQEVITNAACGILWGGSLNFGLGIKHGWKPLGKPRHVTKAEGNIVYEIDGAYAAKLYEEYLACDVAQLKKELKIVSIFYPIGVYLADKEEYLVRNILAIRNDGALVCQGNIPSDSQIRLMIGTKESCLAAAREAAGQAKKALVSGKAEFVLMFDSISRYMLLGRDAVKELEIVKNEFGSGVPVLGFYTYGEQGPLSAVSYQGKAYSHNQTITLLAIGG
ncbi:MAG: FIST N-terminal domain-containing protein [Candidatus Omnitrophica bacterium]|nr:FIST N-terminal domain-containing protein [Candidatus Omnitrophota bacterium]